MMHLYLQKFSASGGVIRKPPLVPDLGVTRGGFLKSGTPLIPKKYTVRSLQKSLAESFYSAR